MPLTAPGRFTCPHCGETTPHPDDVRERYCPRCHWWTGVPELYEPWRAERAAGRLAGPPPRWGDLDLWAVESSPSALVVSLTCRGCGGVVTLSRLHTDEPITLGRMLRFTRTTTHLDGCPVPA